MSRTACGRSLRVVLCHLGRRPWLAAVAPLALVVAVLLALGSLRSGSAQTPNPIAASDSSLVYMSLQVQHGAAISWGDATLRRAAAATTERYNAAARAIPDGLDCTTYDYPQAHLGPEFSWNSTSAATHWLADLNNQLVALNFPEAQFASVADLRRLIDLTVRGNHCYAAFNIENVFRRCFIAVLDTPGSLRANPDPGLAGFRRGSG